MQICYEVRDKPSTCFLNFEKTKAVQSLIKKLEIKNKEISDANE